MAGSVSPAPWLTFFDGSTLAAGYQLFTYEAGTSTKLTVYQDVDLTTPHTNPIILDANGTVTIFTSTTSIKFVLADPDDTDPPASPIRTQDNVPTIPVGTGGGGDLTGTAGEDLAAGDSVYLSDGSGGNTAGRWYKTDADNTYSSTDAAATGFVASAILTGVSGTIQRTGRITGLSSLTAGSIYYASATAGAVTISAPTNARAVGVADTTTSLVILSGAPVPTATATVAGIVSTGTQEFGGAKNFAGAVTSDVPIAYTPPGGAADVFVPCRLTSSTTAVGNVGAGEDTLMSYTLPASTLTTNGMAVKVIAWGHTANNANAKTLKGYFGATQVFGGSGISLTVSELGSWMAGFVVMRTGAATQACAAQVCGGPAGSGVTLASVTATTPAETLSGTVLIKFTGQATSDNDVTQEGFVVELLV